MCCACGGGETNEDESIGFCVDTNIGPDGETLADDWDDDCIEYARHIDWCGEYDNDEFFSNSMCCACGGGARTWE